MRASSKLVYGCAFVLGAGICSAAATTTAQASSLFDFWRSDPAINQVDDLGDYGVEPSQPSRNQATAASPATNQAAPLSVFVDPQPVGNQAAPLSNAAELSPRGPASAWQISAAAGAKDDLGDYDEDYRHAPAMTGSSRPVRLSAAPAPVKTAPQPDLNQLWRSHSLALADDLDDYADSHNGVQPQSPAQPAAVPTGLAGVPAEWRVTAEELRAFMRNEVPEQKQQQAGQYDWKSLSDIGDEDDLGDYSEDYSG